ncbi:MAG: phytanoyl-CoA dioxygenase family protein [Cyanobacteria bacterium SZAS LIN-2]|nr:phytanoyl-CoA dioxygenase family protein [Cyanobacteria bacterium SZAS LIN-2]
MTAKLLTAEQLNEFERDGFVVVRQMYDAAAIARLSAAIDQLVERTQETGKQMSYFEDSLLEPGKRILSRIEKFVEYQDDLRNLVYEEKMIGRVSELLGEKAILFKEKINFKMAGGGGFEAHQDIQPGWDDYCQYFISVLVTIDDSNAQNGCLELSPGHHKRGLIGEHWKPLTGEQLAGIEFTKYEMAPGDVAFFDCFVPHRSAPNLTNKQRRNLYLTFNKASEGDHRLQYYADKRVSYPPDLEREPGKEYSFRV